MWGTAIRTWEVGDTLKCGGQLLELEKWDPKDQCL